MSMFQRSSTAPRDAGFLASLRRLGAGLVGLLHTRAELLAREFERERVRVTRLLLFGIVALFFLVLGATTFTIFIIVLFWDSHRLAATGILTLFYFAVSMGLVFFIKGEAARSTKPFASTIAQFKKDREEFFSRR